LVLWIAKHVKGIEDLFAYADDCFSIEVHQRVMWYPPFQRKLPRKQAQLLFLFDELGIPHEERKQISGSILKVIGFNVDTNLMTFSMTAESKSKLLAFIREFLSKWCAPLKDFQRLAGWVNWALNVFPLLRPSLCNVYQKFSEKSDISPHTLLTLNNAIRADLKWLTSHVERSDGIFLLKSVSWA
ncbi:hypothetical protein BDZ94DRAFT_1136979, partial [Collybia nuda]